MAEKNAAIPVMVAIFRSLLESFVTRPMPFPRHPPICRAAPSRPAEPPQRWVRIVPVKIAGSRAILRGEPSRTFSITVSVPLPSSLNPLYIPTIATPARGRKYSSHGYLKRRSVAPTTPLLKRAPVKPHAMPIATASIIHSTIALAYLKMYSA